MSRLLRALVVAVAALFALVATAPPAGAHSVSGSGATNYRTTLHSVEPAIPGLRLSVIEAGSRLELENDTGQEVVVLGYSGEPYLRVGPAGVEENQRSPATYLNRDRQGGSPVPPEADPAAEPRWERIDGGTVARWHDHRAHWMGSQRPPSVAADPGRRHVINEAWTVELLVGDTRVVATGSLEWVPGPSPWPWLAGAAVLAVATFLLVWRTGSMKLVGGLLLALLVIDAVHLAGILGEVAGGTGTRLGKLLSTSYLSLVAWALIVTAVVALWRRPVDGMRLTALAAVMIAVTGGFTDLGYLNSSTVPFSGPDWLARAIVTVTIGVGVGLAAAAVVRVFRAGLGVGRAEAGTPGRGSPAEGHPRTGTSPVGDR